MTDRKALDVAEQQFLSDYDISQYERPSVATDIAVFTMFDKNFESHRKDAQPQLHILMIQRGEHPFINRWALPGGFVRSQETVEECAMREIREETDLLPVALMPIGVFSQVDRDPRGRVISNAFASIINEAEEVKGGSDAVNAKWFQAQFDQTDDLFTLTLTSDADKIQVQMKEQKMRFGPSRFETVSGSPLAFDHAEIIATAISALRREADRFDVIFDFLPDVFTLGSMQKVQETLLGAPLLTANFRRKATDYVEETDDYTEGAGHRPARLYKRRIQI